MSILFFGTPEFALPALRALVSSGEKVSLVVTRPDALVGRKKSLTPPPVKTEALSLGIELMQPKSVRTEEFLRSIHSIHPEFIVLVAYGRILPKELLQIPRRGVINVHASLLPRLRGASPIAHAIINCHSQTGVTTMLMNEGLDEGDILLKSTVGIDDTDTAGTLAEKLAPLGAELLMKTLDGIRSGAITPVPQEGEPSYAPILRKEDGILDWSMSARLIDCFVRGMSPWPGAQSCLGGRRVKILQVSPDDTIDIGAASAGEVIDAPGGGLAVAALDSAVVIRKIQLEGKKPVTGRELLGSGKVRAGDRFICSTK